MSIGCHPVSPVGIHFVFIRLSIMIFFENKAISFLTILHQSLPELAADLIFLILVGALVCNIEHPHHILILQALSKRPGDYFFPVIHGTGNRFKLLPQFFPFKLINRIIKGFSGLAFDPIFLQQIQAQI